MVSAPIDLIPMAITGAQPWLTSLEIIFLMQQTGAIVTKDARKNLPEPFKKAVKNVNWQSAMVDHKEMLFVYFHSNLTVPSMMGCALMLEMTMENIGAQLKHTKKENENIIIGPEGKIGVIAEMDVISSQNTLEYIY